jgi:hypothetical protein
MGRQNCDAVFFEVKRHLKKINFISLIHILKAFQPNRKLATNYE